ncbi:Crp/Fnr family transcriptional regulator [Methylobacterium sp. BTF04]|uniref:helix-turn-helix domain-containing protein n=1 Tax=Methylobacterium sp. BTF04 TaxID=2708300 RepID=UPI0013D622F2|nr:helix-turn-helix domain-containing protein [Methylobacterium sp. BTF04]NEU11673.1 Crp/Fnr family transcriptional regulator [Methylobacterium sp. BTF04]
MTSNESGLSDRNGAAARDQTAEFESNAPAMRPTDVIVTRYLASRESKAPRADAQAAALSEIIALIDIDPRHAVKRALDWAIDLCDAGSAGLSLLEPGSDGVLWFRWDELSGPLEIHIGGGAPRHFSPCGLCLDAGATILVQRPFAAFEYMNAATQPVQEGLIAPIYTLGGVALGTVWLVHHEVGKHFDAQDARVLEELTAVIARALAAGQENAERPLPVASTSAIEPPTRPDGSRSRMAAVNPFVRKLAGFVTLSDLDEAILQRVSAEPVPVAPRTDLIREGDPTGGVFLVMEGMACRYRQLSNGRRQITAFMLPGDFCDLDVALLSRMDHAIMTLTPARVTQIPRHTVLDLTRNYTSIAEALRKTTLVDEATLREWLVNIGSRPALERIAHLFCELQVRLQVVGLATEDRYELPITQIDLADTTGLSSVHVNRTLQELRRRGLITLAGRALTILDPAELRRLADFRADYLHLKETSAA